MLQTVKLNNNLVFTLFIACVKVVVVIGSNYSFLKSEDCDCYILGTIASIEGKSICNTESLQCKCHPNVIGKNCDQCMVGYYKIFSGYGCFPCNCSPIGAFKNACDKHTGQCLCKPGYIGLKCDQCDFDKYQKYILKCETWYFNLRNSRKHQCNNTGCLQIIEGNYCKKNFNILKGCSPCPACYFIVQDKFKDYEDYFNYTINTINNNFPVYVTKYLLFIKQISDFKMLIQNLDFKCEHNLKFYKFDILTKKLLEESEYFYIKIFNMVRLAYEIFEYNKIQQLRNNINAGIIELQNIIQDNKELLENSAIISTTTSKHSNKMTDMSKNVLEILNNMEKKVDDTRFISNNTLQMCKETCKLNATYFKISTQVHYKLLALHYDIIKANKRIKSMDNYIKNLQNKTSFTKRVSKNFTSQVFQIKIFSKNFIFSELNMTEANFNKSNLFLQHIIYLHNSFIENQSFFNKIWNYVEVKEKKIQNGLCKLKIYKNQSSEAMEKFEMSKSTVEVVHLNYKELEKLKKRTINIYDQTTAILNTHEDITNIFENIIAVVKYIDDLQFNLLYSAKTILENEGIMMINLKTVYDFDQQITESIAKLNKCHLQLKNVKEELHHSTESLYKYEYNLKLIKEYFTVLNTLPTTHDQLNKIEKDIEKMEKIISRIYDLHKLLAQRNHLKQQVNNIKAIIESLPDDDGTLCEAAQPEP